MLNKEDLKRMIKEELIAVLGEGGNIFKGETARIPLEYINPTLDKYRDELSKLFPMQASKFAKFNPVGSVGKKAYSGDIDVAFDVTTFFPDGVVDANDFAAWNIDPKEWEAKYNQIKKRARTATEEMSKWKAFLLLISKYINENSDIIKAAEKKTKFSNIFTLFPQYNPDGEQMDIGVQIDWMVGNLNWLKFAYYSDSPLENLKGLHRTQLLLSLFNSKGYSFVHGMGVRNKETGKYVARDVDSALELLGDLYGSPIDEEQTKKYYSLYDYLTKNSNPELYQKTIDTYIKILDSTRVDIPFNLQDYWKANKDRLRLTGRYLPDSSNLKK
jgi:hypothetical protein